MKLTPSGGDDTAAIRSAVASNTDVELATGNYLITDQIDIGSGQCRTLRGTTGTKIVMRGKTGTRVGFLIRNQTHFDLTVSGIEFACENLADNQEGVFYGISCRNVTIRNCKFTGITRGHAVSFVDACDNILIISNHIEAHGHEDKVSPVCIKLHGTLNGVTRTQWLASGTLPSIVPLTNSLVAGNYTTGGYYGVSLSAAHNCVVEDNTFDNNKRGVSCQDSSNYNVIRNNRILRNISSGIHIAYGASYNLIEGNWISTTASIGQGILQSYVAAKHNKFINNRMYVTTTRYCVYLGVQADGCIVEGNHIEGNPERAYIAVESDWNSKSGNRNHYGFNAAPDDNFARGSMKDILVKNNTLVQFNNQPSVLLSAINQYNLTNVTIANNVRYWERLKIEELKYGSGNLQYVQY
jgi:parallel beta-helix repeat protein